MQEITEEILLHSNLSEEEKKEISNILLTNKNLILNYLAAKKLNINKIKHLQIVIESKNPELNLKCIKYIIKSNDFTNEEKKLLINFHSHIVLHSNNIEIIKDMQRFIKYNPINKPAKMPHKKNKKKQTK